MARWRLDFAGETIGDDQAGKTMEFLDLGGEAAVQTEQLAGGAFPAKFARGNVAGVFAVNITKSHPTLEEAWNYLFHEYGRLGVQADLKLYAQPVSIQWSGAILRHVSRAPSPQSDGVRLCINYVFEITTLQQA